MAERDILAVLDQLHIAASSADGSAYFSLYTPEAVFIGTDAAERWTKQEFQAYAAPYFSQGKGWTYTPRPGSRHVTIVPETDGRVAFFEELLDSEKYGTCRGTGVVRNVRGEWKVCQYHLTFPVPNDMAGRVTGEIKALESKDRR
jgi:ketosteroid isomerase-like protein